MPKNPLTQNPLKLFMRVAMYYNNRDVRLEELPKPKIGPSELLVKVMASGICGSDVLEWYRIKRAPRVLGHEITGEIVEVGNGVKHCKVGDRVFVSHHVPCGACRYCRDGQHTVCETLRTTNFDPGGFAEYVRVPKINVEHGTYLLPDEISFEDGTFIEPLACAVRGQRIANVKSGHTMLVIGSGIAGLLHIKLARARGVEKIIATDINENRLKAAKRFGADAVIKAKEDVPAKLRQLNENRPADRVIVCTGALLAITQALQSVDKGGTILFFAPTEPGVEVTLPFNEIWFKCATLTTSYAAAPKDIKEAIELIRTRKVSVGDLITHRLGLAETGLGFKLVADAKESLKVIIEPQR
ncbi:MAG: zinc-dependent dehydrogenase [Candidatus Hodarchaeaceae archaeon]|nr:zinc-dependent dehydrogenase [Candidatus Hodarchaeaceae archaeon]